MCGLVLFSCRFQDVQWVYVLCLVFSYSVVQDVYYFCVIMWWFVCVVIVLIGVGAVFVCVGLFMYAL